MPFRRENRHLTLSIVLIVASLMVIAIGVQSYLAHQDDKARDQAKAAQDRADRDYADCLTDFAADLVDTLQASRQSNVRVETALTRKDKALDRLLVISAAAQASGAKTQDQLPPGLLHRYERVLAERIAAQKEYTRAVRNAQKTRVENPLVSPKVVCTR